jgi:cellulose synthase/poly-beta-1,6-N-acetylglucosamine synthase-like glycosyltransferase
LSPDRPADTLITVVTPSYNRAHTLEDAYRSLLDQWVPMEWIIVDDGSADGTGQLIEKLATGAPFPVRYLRQDHCGKHVAVNRGVAAARGDLVGLLDSDDLLIPGALSRLVAHWMAIPDRSAYVGVTGLDVDQAGLVIGDRFPAAVVEATWQEMHYRYRVRGDKWGLQRADVLREHPFPEEHRGFVYEATVWREIGRNYRTRYVNELVLTVGEAGLDRISLMPFADQAAGAVAYYAHTLTEDIGWLRYHPAEFARTGVHLTRGLFHQRVPVHRQPARLGTWQARALWAAALPLGWLLYLRDRRSSRS